jgi:predicted TIM-barrel fold metal-dependent hydrolase
VLAGLQGLLGRNGMRPSKSQFSKKESLMENPVLELEQWFDTEIAQLNPFDASVWLGYPHSGRIAYHSSVDVLEALHQQGLQGAMLAHTMALFHDPGEGNQAILDVLQDLPNCFGIMTLLPEGTGEFTHLTQTLEHYLSHRMRAARLYPREHRYTLRIPTIPRLLEALQSLGIPLFIPISQTSWDEIGALARSYPQLAVLVEGVGHHEFLNIRSCLPWLEAVPNLLVSTHNQFLCGGLEVMVNRLGAERIIFASNQPIDDPAAGLSLLATSKLSLKVRQQIAHRNALHLVEQVGKGGYFV